MSQRKGAKGPAHRTPISPIQHTIIGDRVRCVLLGKGQPIPDRCRYWQPTDPLRYWPPLAPNFSTPKKWLGRS